MTKKGNDILERIIAFNEAKGGGVVIQKAAKGYFGVLLSLEEA
jgi:hypothetical protein